jgi:hypothetical protein
LVAGVLLATLFVLTLASTPLAPLGLTDPTFPAPFDTVRWAGLGVDVVRRLLWAAVADVRRPVPVTDLVVFFVFDP